MPLLVALHVARTATKLGFLASAASCAGMVVMRQEPTPKLLAVVLILLLLTILVGLLVDRRTTEAEVRLAREMREAAVDHLGAMPGPGLLAMARGHFTISLQRYPQALAALVIGHRIASTMMVVCPLMTAAAMIFVSWQAAALIVVLTPVMIVFFVLVGGMIRSRAEAQERAFSRLAGQFSDRVRTLPTILANHAEAIERARLSDRLATHADKTMGVLGIAFLNAAVIDFFASLSIAMLAVFLGLGHLKLAMIPGFSDIELRQSLFILMLAPEFFAPFRRFSEQYHAKAEGMAAAEAWDRLLNPATRDTSRIALGAFELRTLPQSGLVALVGPSGSGKSTLLRHLVGVDPGEGYGTLDSAAVSWVSTEIHFQSGTVRDALLRQNDVQGETALESVAGAVGLLDDLLLPGGLEAHIAEGGANLSGGQRLRVALARAALGGRTVVADEPTAKLDAAAARAVRDLLKSIAAVRLVVVATHDPELAAMADQEVQVTAADIVDVKP